MSIFTRRLHNLPLFGLLLLSLLTSPVSTFGYVWCVTPDGHSALEEAVAGDCSWDHHDEDKDRYAAAALTVGADSCGPCLDVPHKDQWGSSRSRQGELPVILSTNIGPIIVATQTPLPEGLLNTHRVIDPLPRTPAPILHQRTIVLLI